MSAPLPSAGDPTPSNALDRFRRIINRGLTTPVVGRRAAITLAIAAARRHTPEPHVWTYTDAVLASGRWLCILEEPTTVYVVEVHPRTGEATVALKTVRRQLTSGTTRHEASPGRTRPYCLRPRLDAMAPGRPRSRAVACQPHP